MDDDLAWAWSLSASEMFDAIREGKVDKSTFEVWVENKYDAGYESSRDDGAFYGYGTES